MGHGHPGATGGSLPFDDFLALAAAMGFDRDAVRARFDRARQAAEALGPA